MSVCLSVCPCLPVSPAPVDNVQHSRSKSCCTISTFAATNRENQIYIYFPGFAGIVIVVVTGAAAAAAATADCCGCLLCENKPQSSTAVQSVRLVFQCFFLSFFFWIYAHTWICIWPQQSAASKSPFTSFSSLHSLYSLLPVCQLQPFKVKHLKRHTLRMINMNATHLHLIYYSTHACTQAHTHGHYSCTIVSAFFPPYLRWIWRFDLR